MLRDLLNLGTEFMGTLTTGATAGNILGLALGREHTVMRVTGQSVSLTGEGTVKVFSAGGHSSLSKSCSILGIGRNSCQDLTVESHPANFNFPKLEQLLKRNQDKDVGSVVVATFGEVNTGTFTSSVSRLHALCRKYDAWLHVDAAFGILARIHPELSHLSLSLELSDSISFDAHKFFNVPYDCGVFLTRHPAILKTVCANAVGGGYLPQDDYSPLNIGIENSRRFRALPLYASLLSLGRSGYEGIVVRCVRLAKTIGEKLQRSHKFKVLWPVEFNIVLFQVEGCTGVEENNIVRDKINATGRVYLSGTVWRGEGALRIAVCNHLTPMNIEDEASEIVQILSDGLMSPKT